MVLQLKSLLGPWKDKRWGENIHCLLHITGWRQSSSTRLLLQLVMVIFVKILARLSLTELDLSPAHPKTLTHGSTKQHTLINSGGAVESVKTIINTAEVWTDLSRKKDLWLIKQVRLVFVLLQKIYLWARSKEIHVRAMGALATKVLSRRAKQGRSRNFIAQTSFVCLGRELGTWKTHLLTKDVP